MKYLQLVIVPLALASCVRHMPISKPAVITQGSEKYVFRDTRLCQHEGETVVEGNIGGFDAINNKSCVGVEFYSSKEGFVDAGQSNPKLIKVIRPRQLRRRMLKSLGRFRWFRIPLNTVPLETDVVKVLQQQCEDNA